MEINYNSLEKISKQIGDAFYILDMAVFQQNYNDLLTAYRSYYYDTAIAYSYKTNYTPILCEQVDKLGGFAEVVSSMEVDLAVKSGVSYNRIFFNGPYKDYAAVEEVLLNGGLINIDSLDDFDNIQKVATNHPGVPLFVGIRVNYELEEGGSSRFGIDFDSDDLTKLLMRIDNQNSIKLVSVHSHFAPRSLDSWKSRMIGLKRILNFFLTNYSIRYVSLGGGLYGRMHPSLKKQFPTDIPTFEQYAEVAARGFSEMIKSINPKSKPTLIIEPGTALVGDAMKFCAKVYGVKKIRDKYYATVKGSMYNINPTLNKKNPPIEVISSQTISEEHVKYDIAGYTCIETDFLYRDFVGHISINDFILFSNVGSYSIVLKPPFILPNFPIIELSDTSYHIVKSAETFDDIFRTFSFGCQL